MRSAPPLAARTPRPAAFTLVELMIVVSIIMILTMILMPAVTTVIRYAKATRGQAVVYSLKQGCFAYQQAHRRFPGQLYPQMLAGDGGPYTGSQVLAACMIGYAFTDIPAASIGDDKIKQEFGSLSPRELITVNNRPNTISDNFADTPAEGAMAVLYYPARLGIEGLDQYKEGDNAAYLTGDHSPKWKSFKDYIESPSLDAEPFNPDEFILIAPGSDREYGTSTDFTNR
jgi:type II secretory pathway pseudopilin PulG